MKGISLPIEIVVVLAIGVVIVASILFLMGRSFGTATDDFELQKALQSACQLWTMDNCQDSAAFTAKAEYIFPGRTAGSCSTQTKQCSVAELCQFSGYDNAGCKKRCGCE